MQTQRAAQRRAHMDTPEGCSRRQNNQLHFYLIQIGLKPEWLVVTNIQVLTYDGSWDGTFWGRVSRRVSLGIYLPFR